MTLEYRGYKGSVLFDEVDGGYHGLILHTKDLVMYCGKDMGELVEDFKKAVDDYIETIKNL